jgi:cell division transport system permease protein
MTLDLAHWRPAALLPGKTGGPAWLAPSVAMLALLASLGSIGVVATVRSAQTWAPLLAGSVTVAVGDRGLESADAAAARAAEILAHAPGVGSAQVLDPSDGDTVIGRLIESPAGRAEAAAPRLLAVTFRPDGRATASDLRQALRREGVAAGVDDHGAWSGPTERAGMFALAAAGALVLAAVAGMIAAVALAARRALSGASARIALMHRLGASDGLIAGAIQARMVPAVALWALVGAGIAAALTLAAESRLGPPLALMAPLDSADAAAVLIWPVIAALIGLIAARLAAAAVSRRLP